MSDSFADLWSSSAPLPPKNKPQTLSSVSASSSASGSTTAFSRQNSTSSNNSKPDAFALLSASGTSTPRYGSGLGNGMGRGSGPPSRSMTPATATTTSSLGAGLGAGLGGGVSRSGSAAGGAGSNAGRVGATTTAGGGGGGDAFSDLFSSLPSSNGMGNGSGNKTMTLAARLAIEAEQRSRGVGMGRTGSAGSFGSVQNQHQKQGTGGDDAWAGLDLFATRTGSESLMTNPSPPAMVGASSTSGHTKPVKVDDEDDWGLADFGAAPAPASTSTSTSTSTGTRTRTQPNPKTKTTAQSIADAAGAGRKGVSLWDLDEFAGSSTSGTGSGANANSKGNANAASSSSFSSSSRSLFPDDHDDHDAGDVASPDVDFDFGSREDQDFGMKEGRGKGLLDIDNEDHSYGRVGGMGRGLLDDEDDRDDGFGFGAGVGVGVGVRGDGNGNGGFGGHGHGHGGEDEDDILGMLSKPVEVVKARVGANVAQRTRGSTSTAAPSSSSNPTSSSTGSSVQTSKRRLTASPPPHILGQLVEMGFSVAQAKKALGETKDGMDVQAALESLLGGGGGDGNGTGSGMEHLRSVDAGGAAAQSSPASGPGPGPAPRARGAPKGQKERERERLERARLASSSSPAPSASSSQPTASDIQEQADKLLAQASEIGRGVFSKASAFWKEGKERALRVYEESVEGSTSAGGGAPLAPGAKVPKGRGRGAVGGGGRPKWMQEAVSNEREHGDEHGNGEQGGFRDGWEREEADGSRRGKRDVFGDAASGRVQHHEEEVDLFGDAGEMVSSQDKPRQVQRQDSSSSSQAPRPTASRPSVPLRTNTNTKNTSKTRTPVPIPTRTLIPASPSALALAVKHRTLGTEQFKLGQFAAAAESYTTALVALPEGHLLRVPLLTNRAVAHLRCGEYKTAVEDCERGVEGVFGREKERKSGDGEFGVEDPLAAKVKAKIVPPPVLNPGLLPPALVEAGRRKANEGGWGHSEGVGVDLLDCYVKALRRAAEGLEGRERWEDAEVWWGVLSRCAEGEGAGGWVDEKAKKEAVVGGVRCRKMLEASGGKEEQVKPAMKPRPKTKPRPPPKSTPSTSSGAPSQAVLALQSSNAAAEADDAARHALKDSVDARLSAWKTGKETNIRALLASLEGVLGAEGVKGLGKMGIADLVSPAQVKKGYVRAIGRVHPDKLNAGNSTLEQRMLANGVFGGLNEAWIAFQAGQK